MDPQSLSKIDHSTLKIHQVTLILLNILAFVINAPWVAVMVTFFMFVGVLRKVPGFGFIYTYALKPLKLVKPEILDDNPEPHRFSQLLGGLFMAAGSMALYLNATLLGWSLIWLVVALAALNAFGGFCVGCALYYWLARINLPGFSKHSPQGTIPGKRPLRSMDES
jgi:hypothetical protein